MTQESCRELVGRRVALKRDLKNQVAEFRRGEVLLVTGTYRGRFYLQDESDRRRYITFVPRSDFEPVEER